MKLNLIFPFAPLYRQPIYQLIDKNYDCHWIFCSKTNVPIRMMDISILHNVTLCGNRKELYRGWYYMQGIGKKRIFNSKHIIMVGESRNLSMWYILLRCKLFHKGIKTFLWGHGYYGKENKIQKLIKKLYNYLCDYHLLYGNYAKNLMIKEGFNEKKLHVVYNSLAYDEQVDIRKSITKTAIFQNHFKNDCYNLIFVGRLTKVKQLDILLQALSKLNKQNEKYNLTLIGEGEMKNELLNLAKNLSIENNVWLYGATYNEEELSELIYNADLCVSPGNVGLTAIHAMSYGCPVITHDNFPYQMPEFESIEKDRTGDFFKCNNVLSLVDTIQNWFFKEFNREIVRQNCYDIIDSKYNPHYQLLIIKSLLKT